MIDRGENMVILDSRPWSEYHQMNIPTGVDCPGAELAYRVHDLAPDPETTVVVNCAGRTRSIIGAQSLIKTTKRFSPRTDLFTTCFLCVFNAPKTQTQNFAPLSHLGAQSLSPLRHRRLACQTDILLLPALLRAADANGNSSVF